MKSLALALLACATLAGHALAQHKADDPSAQPPVAATTAVPSAGLADGEVRKIDREAAKLTLRHGEIKHLDMPPMTMVFMVKEPALLDKVKVGDKVKFRAEKTAAGYVVTGIESAR